MPSREAERGGEGGAAEVCFTSNNRSLLPFPSLPVLPPFSPATPNFDKGKNVRGAIRHNWQ